jgi:general secretion pathway protein L
MLKAILTWWLQQLRSLLPDHWQGIVVGRTNALIVDCGALGSLHESAELLHRRRGKEYYIGSLGIGSAQGGALPRTSRCVLRLAGSLLRRDVVLPASVEGDIPRILTYEMGRLAPFSVTDIFWNWRIVHRDDVRRRLTVQLWYIPRKALQPMLAMLNSFQLAPAELEVVEPAGQVFRLRLGEPSQTRHFGRRAAVAAVAIPLVSVVVPFVMQSMTLGTLTSQLANVRPQAQRSEMLRDRLAPQEPGAAANASEAHRLGDVLQVLAAVTNAFPDDTILTDFTFRQRKVTVAGSSNEAALLIAALSGFPLIRDPNFTAPIVRDPATSRDSFSLHADLAP